MLLLGPRDNLAASRMRTDPIPATVPCVGTVLGFLNQTGGDFRVARQRSGTTYRSEWHASRLNAVWTDRSFMGLSGIRHTLSVPSMLVSCLY